MWPTLLSFYMVERERFDEKVFEIHIETREAENSELTSKQQELRWFRSSLKCRLHQRCEAQIVFRVDIDLLALRQQHIDDFCLTWKNKFSINSECFLWIFNEDSKVSIPTRIRTFRLTSGFLEFLNSTSTATNLSCQVFAHSSNLNDLIIFSFPDTLCAQSQLANLQCL